MTRVLFDNDVNANIAAHLPDTMEVTLAYAVGLATKSNSDLIRAAAEMGFDALLTMDRNMAMQWGARPLPIPVVVLNALRKDMASVMPHVPVLAEVLASKLDHSFHHVGPPKRVNRGNEAVKR